MRAATIMALAGWAAVGGCHDHDGWDHHDTGVVYDPGSTWYYRYENGHPLAVSTTEPAILAGENALADRINDHRVAIGEAALIDDSALRDLARAHSIHMARYDFTGSVNPEHDDPGERAEKVGIPWSEFAENIVYEHDDPDDVYHHMINSPWMHDHIDDPRFVSFGVGYEHDASSWYNDYWTVDFLEP